MGDGGQDALRRGFLSSNSAEGLKALLDLVHEYEQLQLILDRKKDTGLLSVAYIPNLAEETYRQGLRVLADAQRLTQAIHSSGKERLEAEIVVLDREIESLKMDETQAARVKIREDTVTTHKERLDLLKLQQLRVDGLLHQCQRCEASLARTRIELVVLQADSTEMSVDAVTERLRRTIDQAKEVTEELNRLGF